MPKRKLTPILALAAALALTALPADAQPWTGSGSVGIEVKQGRRADLEGAEVRLRYAEIEPLAGPEPRLTGADGRVSFHWLAPGRWRVDITREGFSSYLLVVEIGVGGSARLVSGPIRDATGDRMRIRLVEPGPAPDPPRPPRPEPAPAPPAPTPPPPEPVPAEPPAAEPATPEPAVAEPAPSPAAPPSSAEPSPAPAPAEPPPTSEPEVAAPAPAPAPEPQAAPEPPAPSPVPESPAAPEPAVAEPVPSPAPEPPAAPEPAVAEPAPSPAPEPPAAPEPAIAEPAPSPAPEPPAAPEPAVGAVAPEPTAPPPSVAPAAEPEPASAAPAPEPAAPPPPAPAPEPEPPAGPFIPPPPARDAAPPRLAALPSPVTPAGADRAAERSAPWVAGTLRSAAAGDCPDCRAGETALTVEQLVASTTGDQCSGDLAVRLRRAARGIAGAGVGDLAGPLIAPGDSAIGRLSAVAASELAEQVLPLVRRDVSCQAVAAVVPADARLTGYVYEAADAFGGGLCVAGEVCEIGSARWVGPPVVETTSGPAVVYGVFFNGSQGRERRARMTLYFSR